MQDSDIWGHTHRMYLKGDGSPWNPWCVPRDYPTTALHSVALKRLSSFIKKSSINWTFTDRMVYCFFRVFMPYFAEWRSQEVRKHNLTQLQKKLKDAYSWEFWNDT